MNLVIVFFLFYIPLKCAYNGMCPEYTLLGNLSLDDFLCCLKVFLNCCKYILLRKLHHN